MGATNLKLGLERKYSVWLGEKKQVDKEIKEILDAYETLPEKQARAGKLDQLIEASEVILTELSPTWDASKVKPRPPRDWTRTFETGSITRWTYDVLRPAKEPMTSRGIAEEIARQQGVDETENDVIDRIRQTVDSHLRKKIGVMVDKIGKYPCYWKIKDFDDRPEAMPSKP